jgi:hypothetical protein
MVLTHHASPANHHKFTTKNHPENGTFRQKTLQKRTPTTPGKNSPDYI